MGGIAWCWVVFGCVGWCWDVVGGIWWGWWIEGVAYTDSLHKMWT